MGVEERKVEVEEEEEDGRRRKRRRKREEEKRELVPLAHARRFGCLSRSLSPFLPLSAAALLFLSPCFHPEKTQTPLSYLGRRAGEDGEEHGRAGERHG